MNKLNLCFALLVVLGLTGNISA